ncbi:MAG: hypothetical protein V7K27_32285 [Nostoc sp.]
MHFSVYDFLLAISLLIGHWEYLSPLSGLSASSRQTTPKNN